MCAADTATRLMIQMEVLCATAHDLRLPLAHIKGFVTSLRRDDVEWDAATRDDFLSEIEREADRMARLLDQVIAQTCPGARPRPPARVKCRPAALVAAALDRVRGVSAQHVVEIHVPPGLPTLVVDRDGIERVLANLLHNACKFSPIGGRVTVSAALIGDMLELTIEDEGPGIADADRERIFEPFFRSAATVRTPGSGLGLAICRSIVTAHGGRIWANARPGGGTTIAVALPLRSPQQRPQPTRHSSSSTVWTAGRTHRNSSICSRPAR
jgi:two-component system, OmpR family, sensor histidine kinase KdpD